MKSIVTRLATISPVLLVLLLLFAGCDGGDGMLDENDAIKVADDIIAEDFPEMVDATRTLESYSSQGRDFYEITYDKTVEVESEGEIVELPRIVVVTIDKETGEQFVEVSN